jgi:hypothetical protein
MVETTEWQMRMTGASSGQSVVSTIALGALGGHLPQGRRLMESSSIDEMCVAAAAECHSLPCFLALRPVRKDHAPHIAKPIWRGVAGSDRAPRRLPAPPRGTFFSFSFFSSFPLLTIFLIHKLGTQLILWNKLCTQLDIYRKSYAHNLSSKKIYTQVIIRVAVHISCTHKFCASQTYT